MSLSTQRLPSSSSSSSTSPSTYDVFLSFCGEDTRNGFTDHLYAALKQRGLVTFRDDEKLQRGNDISQELLTAIRKSQYAVVVLSKNFASSSWCLRELTQIVECMREGRLTVLPVFYHVDPSDVRKQKRNFAEAFEKHRDNLKINKKQKKSRKSDLKEMVDSAVDLSDVRKKKRSSEKAFDKNRDNPNINRTQMKSRKTELKEVDNLKFDEDSVKSWRAALKVVGNLSGWHVNNSSEATVVDQIAAKIICELRLNSPEIFKNLVGIDSKVKELVSLLHLEMDDVRYIGIHGMGGVGKTTLAKVLYETIYYEFETSCFISGSKNNQSRSVEELQQEIIREISKEQNTMICNDYEGTKLLVMRLRNKKVLIVFDDINKEQLDALAGNPNWFGGKSRIVITSRDCQFWKLLVNDDNTYEVKLLNYKDALELFCWNVFKRPKPKEKFMELSNKIIRYAGGLPLAVKVIGSSLVGKEMEMWNFTCDYLEANPNVEVLDKLEISYNGLDDMSKELFLDVACFYSGMDENSIIPIWKSLDRHPEKCIDILRDKSLLEFSWSPQFQEFSCSRQFQMHDLIQKMGQRIVCRENFKQPGNRSRLHCFNDIAHILKNKSGTNAVKGVVIEFLSKKQEQLSFEGFSNLPSLEILVIKPKYDWSRNRVLNEGIA